MGHAPGSTAGQQHEQPLAEQHGRWDKPPCSQQHAQTACWPDVAPFCPLSVVERQRIAPLAVLVAFHVLEVLLGIPTKNFTNWAIDLDIRAQPPFF